MSPTHERDLPRLADLAEISRGEQCSTELSFCLPASLAFARRLTWEQTPWIPTTPNSNPISKPDALTISRYLASHLDQTVRPEAIKNALLLGTTYPSGKKFPNGTKIGDDSLGTYPYVFVVFPHAPGFASHDPRFLKVWHDQIVKPAFDRAWLDSGLTIIHGADISSQTRILPPSGTRTPRDALPASGFLERMRNGSPGAVRDYWPAWADDGRNTGSEGRHSDTRATIYHAAWKAIKGMLKDHPNLSSYQNPILLALCRSQVHVNPRLSTAAKYKTVAQEWDSLIDARFVKPGSFKIVFETVIGTLKPKEKEVQITWIGDAAGRQFKRVVDRVELKDGDEADGHRSKKVKTEE